MSETTVPVREIPTAEWVTIPDLVADPFPIYHRLRAEAPIHWVPAVDRYLVTGYHACHVIERDEGRFTADETGSLMKRSMGHSMLRKDDPEHAEERRAYGGVLKPRAIAARWRAAFHEHSERYLDELKQAGPGADLVANYAAPYAAENLRIVMGFHNATQQDMQRWSQTMIDGTGNYADDPDVWAASERSAAEVDVAIDEMLTHLHEHPDGSLLSQLATTQMPLESIRANIKVTIGGGLNEPRDALATTVHALLADPDQLEAIGQEGGGGFGRAFEESIRWVAPIGMYPRQVRDETVLEGLRLPAGSRLGIVIGAANRDPAMFVDPDRFDVRREKVPHLAFGGGNHFCAGAWVARASVAEVALPDLFSLPGLRRDPDGEVTEAGWVFRGVTRLPVRWDA